MQNQATYYTKLGAKNYFPFGWAMPGRQYLGSGGEKYRYGYQGEFSEEDEETGWNSFELRSLNAHAVQGVITLNGNHKYNVQYIFIFVVYKDKIL